MPYENPSIEVPVFLSENDNPYLPLDYSALPTYEIVFKTSIGGDKVAVHRVTVQAITLDGAVGMALIENPARKFSDILEIKVIKGAFQYDRSQYALGDDPEFAPVLLNGETMFLRIDFNETPSYCIVFKRAIMAEGDVAPGNEDRLWWSGVTIPEAIGSALKAYPYLCYDDVLDHMEV
jgi:hypothetical protein